MLTIKKRFPSREIYLAAGVVASVATAGALAAIVSASGLKDQSAIMPTKVVETKDDTKQEPASEKAVEAPVKEYSSTAGSRTVSNTPVASTAPLATTAPSPSSAPTPSVSPEPTPEPTPSVEPSPEPVPEP